MRKNQLGPLIGAVFGLVFVLANTGPLPAGVGIPIRVLAVLAFLRLFTLLRRRSAPSAPSATFGRGYRLVVAVEVAAGAAGLFVISRVLHHPQAAVGWIALVVGLHFFGLAAVWRMPAVNALAAVLSVCGAAGIALAWAGAPQAAVATVAGIAPGAALLGAVAWTLRGKATAPAGA
ncbi:hypothetical protein GCM10020229_54500 [Kitasatospora albolonga]|uniref:hypothetical protein n=1 Tax=Kitasatospora albolonga TaxID=68173 RepID=UPI0031E89CF9